MHKVTKLLALLLIAALAVSALAACGNSSEGETSRTLSKSISRGVRDNSDKTLNSLASISANELFAEEITELSLVLNDMVTAGAESVSFQVKNVGHGEFNYGFADILLQIKTGEVWKTYERIDPVPEIAVSVPAGMYTVEEIRPEQYGAELKAGDMCRIYFSNMPDVYLEFRVR